MQTTNQQPFVWDYKKYYGQSFLSVNDLMALKSVVLDSGTGFVGLIIAAIKCAAVFALYWIWVKNQEQAMLIEKQEYEASMSNSHAHDVNV